MIFDPKGPKQASIDNFGNPVFQIWKIHDKWNREDGSFLYEVQFWEDFRGKNEIYHIDEEEMKNQFGEMVEKWEAWYGMNWKQEYGELGYIWDSKDERSVSTPKRRFDDTPSKSRSIEKRSKSGKSSISGGNNTVNSEITGDTHPRSGNSPPLANVSRPNQGDAYTLMPPPLLPESSKSSRRVAATQQGNVGLPAAFSVPSRLTKRLVSGSSGPVQQPAGDSASKADHLESPSTSRQSARRIPSSYLSSLAQSANTPVSSSNQSGLSPVIDQSAEHSEVAFEDIVNSILEKTGDKLEAMTNEAIAELGPGGNIPMVDINGGEYAENTGMILDAYSERLIKAHSKGLRE
ncbi:hypothetical protein BHYA_0201g00130 [Botrytis hyacinthi]|uniref:Uncharacterized protein n=1 Tax=Botrytis hyacinthi TaxID=278943 RepID=A0A4Z1GGR0_9HELO|nr:hypothetical protein BHYA_0201g00130 [Botrytis hyacinthi]